MGKNYRAPDTFDTENPPEEMKDFGDWIGSWEREFKENHPIQYWIDNSLFKNRGIAGYAPHVLFSEPWKIIDHWLRQVKYAWQRAFRGWDDTVVWSIDVWLAELMPTLLLELKNNKKGIPTPFFKGMEHNENYEFSKEQEAEAETLWNAELDKMIAGFRAAHSILMDEYIDTKRPASGTDGWLTSYDNLEKIFKEGMKSFTEHFFSLWD